MKKTTVLYFLLACASVHSQIINTAPYILTVDELKTWTETGPTSSADLISTVPLATRFTNAQTQFNPALSNDMQIAYLPDGMNNFGNYYGEQSQFNLYNFTHWAYIDKLVWFGGTSSQTIQIPSSPWANTAHKNGVKIFGNVFFAPAVFGGSTATLQNFLEQDADGNFVAIPKMIAIMQYYNFDGWFINQETATNATVAGTMYEFVRDLTAQAEALGKEIMWYDSMVLSGNVGWQNRLNGSNSPFVQNDEDGNTANGFEQRVSSSIFINFFWGSSSFPSLSRTRAATIGRSNYEVFTGADIWPNRNQGNFETNGNTFMGFLHENATTPYTSLGLFAPNCIYNNSVYTNFNNDPADYESFYSAENQMFGGADRNPGIVDATGFKGFCNWIPEASVISSLPFLTLFCTGHGNKKFDAGMLISDQDWHEINRQDILPTWQWAFSENNLLSARWDFDEVLYGGNSLKISGNLPANHPVDLMLFKTKLSLNDPMGLFYYEYTYKNEAPGSHVNLIFSFADDPAQRYEFDSGANTSTGFQGQGQTLPAEFSGREIAAIGLRFTSEVANPNYTVNIAGIRIEESFLGIQTPFKENSLVTISYPDDNIIFTINWPNAAVIKYIVYDLNGKSIKEQSIAVNKTTNYQFVPDKLSAGTYIVKFSDQDNKTVTKKIIVK